MPPVVLEVLANAAMFLAGNLSGQALGQAAQPGKAAAAILLTVLFLGLGALVAWLVDPKKTPLDYAIWAVCFVVGLMMGWKQRRV